MKATNLKVVAVRLPPRLVKRAKFHAVRYNLSFQKIITDALAAYLDVPRKENK